MSDQEMRALARVQNVMLRFGCDSESAWRYLDLREEGHGQYQASVMAGLADPDDLEEKS